MLKYLTGAAAIALAASAVMADPGGGKGGGSGGGNPHAAQGGGGNDGEKAHGNGGGGSDGGEKSRGNGGGNSHQAQGGDNGNGNAGGKHETRAASRGSDSRRPEKQAKSQRGPDRSAVAVERSRGRTERDQISIAPRQLGEGRGRNSDVTNWRWVDAVPQRTRGLIAGCPPGLAKKNNGCLPPGLARGVVAPVFYDNPNWWNFDNRWHDTAQWNDGDYRYYDGYLVRSGERGIDSWLPLLGGALAPGNSWPSQYETQGLPTYYQDYYGLGSSDGYRYYDDTLYRIDPQSQAITAITGLLTGDSFQVGQRMPSGYDVYNLPYSYRDQYRDGPDADYRYSDGSIYQVDPTTQLVQAVIGLLT